jgi:hypothetical protein
MYTKIEEEEGDSTYGKPTKVIDRDLFDKKSVMDPTNPDELKRRLSEMNINDAELAELAQLGPSNTKKRAYRPTRPKKMKKKPEVVEESIPIEETGNPTDLQNEKRAFPTLQQMQDAIPPSNFEITDEDRQKIKDFVVRLKEAREKKEQ